MIMLIGVICVCVWLTLLAVRYARQEARSTLDVSAKGTSIATGQGDSATNNGTLFSRIFRFVCAFALCISILKVLLVYATHWSVLGIFSIRLLLPSAQYFDWFVYLLLFPISLVGAVVFMFPIKKRSLFYQKSVWWLLPSGVTCWFLSSALAPGGPDNSGMGIIPVLISYIPFFLILFESTILLVTWICWFFCERDGSNAVMVK